MKSLLIYKRKLLFYRKFTINETAQDTARCSFLFFSHHRFAGKIVSPYTKLIADTFLKLLGVMIDIQVDSLTD